MFPIQGEPVRHGHGLEVATDQFVRPAQVGDAEPETVRLRHVKPSLRVEPEAPGIFDEGKSDPRVALEAFVPDQTAEGALRVGEGGQPVLRNRRQGFEARLELRRGDGAKPRSRRKQREKEEDEGFSHGGTGWQGGPSGRDFTLRSEGIQ